MDAGGRGGGWAQVVRGPEREIGEGSRFARKRALRARGCLRGETDAGGADQKAWCGSHRAIGWGLVWGQGPALEVAQFRSRAASPGLGGKLEGAGARTGHRRLGNGRSRTHSGGGAPLGTGDTGGVGGGGGCPPLPRTAWARFLRPRTVPSGWGHTEERPQGGPRHLQDRLSGTHASTAVY